MGFFSDPPEAIYTVAFSAYVDVLYRTFFDRNPDTNGKKKWLGQLNSGVGRDKVMASFYNSNEFATIMAGYGIR